MGKHHRDDVVQNSDRGFDLLERSADGFGSPYA